MLFVCCSEQPVFLVYVLLSLMSLFKSYPSVGDLALPLSLLPLWSHTFRCQSMIYWNYTYRKEKFTYPSFFLTQLVHSNKMSDLN